MRAWLEKWLAFIRDYFTDSISYFTDSPLLQFSAANYLTDSLSTRLPRQDCTVFFKQQPRPQACGRRQHRLRLGEKYLSRALSATRDGTVTESLRPFQRAAIWK